MAELDHTEFGLYQRCRQCREWLPMDTGFFTRVRRGLRRGEISDLCRVCAPGPDSLSRTRSARRPPVRICRASDYIAALIGGPTAWR
ncbi:hypothetical protein [Comamonas sp. NLF-1-9]|uniref:hypothetical protein n=1 Tax=Comamonas sp. NLF-1-9 TaxID=2853163 RepID=UPI001C4468B5|nr:hypothetical protein [Comamonas sp. NLF-1-9]QXL84102.1 hypothetical protein KUD94_12810 [Comamonas sp. NLF-1-9]